jgi:hypothetical protein
VVLWYGVAVWSRVNVIQENVEGMPEAQCTDVLRLETSMKGRGVHSVLPCKENGARGERRGPASSGPESLLRLADDCD